MQLNSFVVLSDPHFYRNVRRASSKNSLSSWLDIQFDIVGGIFDFAIDKNADFVIINGDIFEEKTKINTIVYNSVWDFFRSYKYKIDIIINTGNHDLFAYNRDSSLKPFSDIATIITKPLPFGNFLFIPYGYRKEDYYDTEDLKFLFTHADICRWETGITYDNFDIDFLNKFEYVFNGHIHCPDEFNNIINIGSIMRQDFNEAGKQKRFLYFDGNTMRSINIKCPEFITIDNLEDTTRKKIEEDDFNYYRISVDNSLLNDPIFNKHNVSLYKIKTKRREVRIEQGITEEEELKEYIQLKALNSRLNHKLLLKVGRNLVKNENR